MNHLIDKLYIIIFIYRCRNHVIKSCCNSCIILHREHLVIALYLRYMCQNILIMWRCDLCTILPIHLISIVFRWIVAGCNYNTGHAAKLSHCIGKLRCRAKRIEDIGFDSIRIQAKRSCSGEFRRHTSRIKCNYHTLILCLLTKFTDIVRKSLCCLRYGIDIHAVCTRANYATQSSGSKLQISIEPILDLLLIACDRAQLFLRLLIKIWGIEPKLIFLLICHVHPPYICLMQTSP